ESASTFRTSIFKYYYSRSIYNIHYTTYNFEILAILMTFNLAPVGPTLPPVLYFRQPTLANPRPRLVDLTTFVPRAKGRGPEYRDEVRIFIGAYPHRDV